MNQELLREWFQFQKSAINVLRRGHRPEQRRLLQLLILPSFEANTGYEIFEPSRKSGYTVTRIHWRKDTDSLIFHNPVDKLKHPYPLPPTIEQSAAPLTPDLAQAILKQLRSISLPLFPEKYPWGLDGITYEVTLGSDYISSRFSWWVEAPPEWRPLETAFHESVRLLEEQFASAPPGS